MPFRELVVLIPCHGLDDFPLYLEGPLADGLLSAWTALWHPALLHGSGHLPAWQRADDPPTDGQGRLLIVPEACRPLLAEGWLDRIQASGGVTLWAKQTRRQYAAAALAVLPEEARGGTVVATLADDFHALGFAYLMIELLARQMRYLTTIDLVQLENQTLAAAAAAMRDDEPAARDHLGRAFDVLAEARDRFYPTTAWLIDLTLVAPTTIGPALLRDLDRPGAKNLLLSASTLQAIDRSAPETLAALRAALAADQITVIGGAEDEDELPLLLAEEVARRLAHRLQVYEALLGKRPAVFGRRRAGLSAVLPGLIYKFGFQGALHVTLDGGRFPRTQQARGRWEGTDATAVEALFRVPLDAARPETFLAYPQHMGGAMDHDYFATLCLAHWPGQGNPWLDDLRRVAGYGPLLGKFTLLEDYLEAIDSYGHLARHEADEYRSNYLDQDVAAGLPDSISRHVRRDRLARLALGLETTACLVDAVRGAVSPESAAARTRAAAWWIANQCASDQLEAANLECEATLASLAAEMAAALGGTAPGDATLQLNPTARPTLGQAVPALGFGVFVGAPARETGTIARELRLVNDRLEVNIHPETGGIGAVRRAGRRGNRLSQQAALRRPDWQRMATEATEARGPYSRMVAEKIDLVHAGPDFGEFVSLGVLLDPEERPVAGFRQSTRLARGADSVEVSLTLDPQLMPADRGWDEYYCARFAWADAACDLRRSVGGSSHASNLDRLEAPHFIELLGDDGTTTLLPGGLPYHRRDGLRRLDTLLIVPGESEREFRFAVGLDLPNPLAAALAREVPAAAASCGLAARAPAWLFHFDQPGLCATGWTPLVEEGRVVGVRVHLQDTLGQMDTGRLRCFRKVAQARMADALGANLMNLRIEEGEAIVVEYAAHEWFIVEAWWA